MRILTEVNRKVKILSFSFFFIFFGFAAVQQYVTVFFSELGKVNAGFVSLILIYLFFMLSNPVAAVLVRYFGCKKSMLSASLFYSIFIIVLLTKNIFLVYIASVLLGMAASLLWTGQNTYLIMASNKGYYGGNAGFFNTLSMVGMTIGILILGFLIGRFSFNLPFLLFSFLPLIGFLMLFGLKDLKTIEKPNYFRLVQKSISSITALRLSTIWFSYSISSGLAIGIIPIEIRNILGIAYIGVLSSMFWIIPILFSYFFGRLSDFVGRKTILIFAYALSLAGLVSLYLSNNAFLLILGVVLLVLNYSIVRPITQALVGDFTTSKNIEFITALFWIAHSAGVLIALLISGILQTKTIYLVSIAVLLTSLLVLAPLFRFSFEEIKIKLAREISS